MATMRTYGDSCGIARALDLVGERWSLLVVRELVLGAKRFTDLRAGLPNLSADVLSQRLDELADAGIVRRHKLPPPAGSWVYELTERGQELEPVILALGRWGSRAPFPPRAAGLGVDALILALRTLFEPGAAGGADGSFELRIGDRTFGAELAERRLRISTGSAERPDAAVEAAPGVLTEVLWHGRPIADAERAGELTISGSREALERFFKVFPAPRPSDVGAGTAPAPRRGGRETAT
jgi:DNA-binding HxlR family transcriptional regulator